MTCTSRHGKPRAGQLVLMTGKSKKSGQGRCKAAEGLFHLEGYELEQN